MPKSPDFVGKRYGRLVIIKSLPNVRQNSTWECVCDCGAVKAVAARHLRSGGTKSCGCWGRENVTAANTKHGWYYTSTYKIWAGMIKRCVNEKTKAYPRYGGRGISVHPPWRDSFEAFLADMGERPAGLSLDRVDNDGNYEPGNCRWTTMKQQNRNRNNNRMLTVFGETHPMATWSEELGIPYSRIQSWLDIGNLEELVINIYDLEVAS